MVRADVLVPTTAGGKLRQLRDDAGNKEDTGGLLGIFISSHFCTPSYLHYYRSHHHTLMQDGFYSFKLEIVLHKCT
jgi:hypothetical protein